MQLEELFKELSENAKKKDATKVNIPLGIVVSSSGGCYLVKYSLSHHSRHFDLGSAVNEIKKHLEE